MRRYVLKIYCCGCEGEIEARLTDGTEIYAHRADLHQLPFWKCDKCNNFVGCHHKTKNRTKPLGCIPTQEIRNARKHIHSVLDPIWQSGKVDRKTIYARLTDVLGKQYHTAEIKSIEEARIVYKTVKDLAATF